MQKKLTVSQLNNYICGVFDDEYVLHNITVEGEISDMSLSGGRTYFTLKENECQLQCISFNKLPDFSVGMLVAALGSVNFYKKTGRITFVISEVSACGEGRLYLDLLKLKAKLQSEGLFDNKLELPKYVKKIGVITSESGAVVHDIIKVVRSRNLFVDIAVYDVRVQGKFSSDEISDAVMTLNENQMGIDVIIIARGGGSSADLQSYNSEKVARTVAQSKIPVMSAVGHETDYTLCDLCASARAGTPSIAAGMVVNQANERIEYLLSLLNHMYSVLEDKYGLFRHRLSYAGLRMTSVLHLIMLNKQNYIAKLCAAMSDIIAQKVNSSEERIRSLAGILDRLSPLKVLERGYAKIVSGSGNEIVSSKQVSSGDSVEIIFRDGKKSAEIK